MFVDAALQRIGHILRPEVPIPSILIVKDRPGPTRLREVESIGGFPTYAAKFLPQVHADLTTEALKRAQRAGLATEAWYDTPSYAFQAPSPLRSTPEEIEQRLQQRIQTADPPVRHGELLHSSHLTSYLGFQGPVSVAHDSAVFTLDHAREFTRSRALAEQGLDGKGVRVAVIDTGLHPDHPMLEGKVIKSVSMVPETPGTDLAGHGTWCGSAIAGQPTEYHGKVESLRGQVIQGMAPGADLIDIKVLTGEGTGLISGVIQGIEAALTLGANMVSMSLGSPLGQTGRTPDAQALEALVRHGVLAVVAAGNSFGWVTVGSPGSSNSAITVGSIAMKAPSPGVASSFSSKGPTADGRLKPDIAAPGGNLRPDETILAATSGVAEAESGEPYALLRGTSMATPIMAGILAQLYNEGLPTNRDQIEVLLSAGTRDNLPVKDNRKGWGVIDAQRLYAAIQAPPSRARAILSGIHRARSRPVLGKLAARAAQMQRLPSPRPDAVRIGLV